MSFDEKDDAAAQAATAAQARSATMKVAALAALLVVAAAAGVFAVFKFVGDERGRELQGWQARLGIVAESRFGAVNGWIERQFGELTGLAENASLQIYMTELTLSGGRQGVTDEPAQASYLRNLLVVTADRAGFKGPILGPDINANVKRVGIAGLALINKDGRAIVATPAFPPLDGVIGQALKSLPLGRRGVIDLFKNAAGKAAMGFAVPVFAVQGDGKPSDQIGWAIGIKEVARELYPLLSQPGEVNKSAETILLRRRGAVIEYLAPLKDGTKPLTRALAADTPGLASAGAVKQPGGFIQGRDYLGTDVLMTSRALGAVGWVLATKIDRAEAMAPADTRLTRLMTALLLVIALIAAMIIAVWRHGTSRRAAASAARYAGLAGRFEGQSRFLRLVTDSQPNAIFIADEDGKYRFANREAARLTGIEADDMLGKTMASVIGPDAAKHHLERNRQALESGEVVSAVHTTADGEGDGDGGRILQSEHIPIGKDGGELPGVLVVESDITEIEGERARRERTLGQLVKTLVAVVDRRDPFAAHHSNHVAAVAGAVAREMDLDEITTGTAEIAGNLMNLGKILVPAEILTKTERLSEDEIQQVRNGILTSADLLEGMEFDGPVVETLRQLQEHWDGTGKPDGLTGDAILASARIVAAANAFVAMVSPRAYRTGVAFDEAAGILLDQAGTVFDRAVVVALINYLENRHGREEWANFATQPDTET